MIWINEDQEGVLRVLTVILSIAVSVVGFSLVLPIHVAAATGWLFGTMVSLVVLDFLEDRVLGPSLWVSGGESQG